jgi:hypothetical protein
VPAAPLTVVGIDKTGPSGLPNRIVRFLQFQPGASDSCLICMPTHFGDSAGESTTSSTSSMNGGNSGNNRSDLDKGNILKPTFNILMEEGRQVFEAYITELRELFLSCCEVTRQGTILQDTTPIVFHKPYIIPEVRPDPSLSHNDIQFMIDFALER